MTSLYTKTGSNTLLKGKNSHNYLNGIFNKTNFNNNGVFLSKLNFEEDKRTSLYG